MRTCGYCGSSIEHRHVNATMCGRKCSKNNWASRNREAHRANSQHWRDNNRTHVVSYEDNRWATQRSPRAEKVVRLFERMNDQQRIRFADWLLRKSHRSNVNFKVDVYLSDYNSEGI